MQDRRQAFDFADLHEFTNTTVAREDGGLCVGIVGLVPKMGGNVRLGICLGTHIGSLEDTHMQVHARTHT